MAFFRKNTKVDGNISESSEVAVDEVSPDMYPDDGGADGEGTGGQPDTVDTLLSDATPSRLEPVSQDGDGSFRDSEGKMMVRFANLERIAIDESFGLDTDSGLTLLSSAADVYSALQVHEGWEKAMENGEADPESARQIRSVNLLNLRNRIFILIEDAASVLTAYQDLVASGNGPVDGSDSPDGADGGTSDPE